MSRSKKDDDPGGYDSEAIDKHNERRNKYRRTCEMIRDMCNCTLNVIDANKPLEEVCEQVSTIIKARL